MPSTIPVRVGDLDILVLDDLLVLDPHPTKLLPLEPLPLLSFSIGKERGIDRGVLGELGSFC